MVNSAGERKIESRMPVSTSSHTAVPRTLARAALPPRVRTTLERALSLITSELDGRLGAMLDEFEQELFRLADTARNPGAESGYMQTLRTLRLNRADLIPRIILELEGGLAGLRSPSVPRAATTEPAITFQDLALVEDSVMDEGTVLHEIASRQESRAGLSLHLLSQRFGVLAGTPALDGERNPLGPQALCRAMRDASQTLQITYDARLLLYRIFDRQVMPDYARALEKLDEALAQDGILPGLTFLPTRARPTPQSTPAPADEAPAKAKPEKPAAPSSNAARAPAPAAATSSSDPQRPHTAWLGQPDSAAEPLHAEESDALDTLQQLIAGRRQLIDKLRPGRYSGPRLELASNDVFDALGALQRQPTSPGATRTLSDVKQTLLAQARQQHGQGAALSQHDSDTFELLGLLFDEIDQQVRPDAPASALLRRMQLPLLRLALRDRAFFVRARHPARQMLNTVAECAARWLDQDDFDASLLAPLQHAISDVVERYDGDEQVFLAGNAQLEAQMQLQVRKAEALERRHVEAARGKEKLEVAKRRAGETLEAVIGEQRLPKFARALLNQAWADVLTLTLLRQGEDSGDWRRQLDVTRELVAACSRADAAPDPTLRQHAETALTQVGYHADEAAVIAQRLTSRISEGEDDPASRTELAIKLKARARLGEDTSRPHRPPPPPRTHEEQLRYEQLRVLPFGTWIEFVTNQQGDTVRRRLSWYSPVTDNALFVNQRGQRVGEQSLDGLARMVVSGQARIVTAEQGRLVDRAWQATINALRSFAGRGDGAAAAGAR